MLESIQSKFSEAILSLFDINMSQDEIVFNETRKEFAGDYTFVIFPLVKSLKKSPKEVGDLLGQWMKANEKSFKDYEIVYEYRKLKHNIYTSNSVSYTHLTLPTKRIV